MVSFFSTLLIALPALVAGFEAPVEGGATVLVTGATGRTGSLLYAKLKADSRVGTVRALVTSLDKARSTLKCTKCDPSEGIYLGNVTQLSTLTAAMKGVTTVAITVGASPYSSPDLQRAIELTGVQNQVRALAAGGGAASAAELRVVLCSSMGTSAPSPKPEEGGSILFWKLNAEVAPPPPCLHSACLPPPRPPTIARAYLHCTCTAEVSHPSPYGAPARLHSACTAEERPSPFDCFRDCKQ
jgi:nucleoside-diphosphate-sugar epimerase